MGSWSLSSRLLYIAVLQLLCKVDEKTIILVYRRNDLSDQDIL